MITAELSVELGQLSAMSMVDVDGTAAVSGAVFIAVALVLNAILIQPYLRIVHERAALTTGAQDAADDTAARAEKLMSEYQSKLAEARADANVIRDSLRTDGKVDESRIVAAAREQAQAALASKREVIERDVSAAKAEVDERSNALSQAIVARVLS
jgi:F-type H+-transporting ATPase subunit b